MTDNEHPYNALPKEHLLDNGKYELVRVLGRPGGFGITYLGFDHHLDEAVAIKEYLPSDLATRATDHSVVPQASHFRDDFQWGRNNFFNEALTLARFDHRHIIKVYRLFEAHNTAYIVMEYAEGETLEEYLEREGPLPEAELKGILYPLLDGLAVVHEAGILHRDIKPSNIMIREDGSPVLIDFGSARQAIGAKSRALSAIVTPGYAPIEQYSSGGNQGAWTDLYALGGVCYSALTGQVPDDATARVPNDPLVPVSRRCAGWGSGAFLSAIDGALSVYGEDRPQSIAVWQKMLEKEETANFWENVADALLEARKPPSPFFLEFVWQRKQTFEKQRREQAAARREQAAQERKAEVARREQAALEMEKQRRERREQAALEKQRQAEQAEQARLSDSSEARRRRTRERQPYNDDFDWIPWICGVVVLLVVGLIRFAGIVTADWGSVFVGSICVATSTIALLDIWRAWNWSNDSSSSEDGFMLYFSLSGCWLLGFVIKMMMISLELVEQEISAQISAYIRAVSGLSFLPLIAFSLFLGILGLKDKKDKPRFSPYLQLPCVFLGGGIVVFGIFNAAGVAAVTADTIGISDLTSMNLFTLLFLILHVPSGLFPFWGISVISLLYVIFLSVALFAVGILLVAGIMTVGWFIVAATAIATALTALGFVPSSRVSKRKRKRGGQGGGNRPY